jgi:hypothetical protein
MHKRVALLSILACFFLTGQGYNVPFSPPSGGTDFTADAGTGQDCVGAWLIFDDDTQATSALDRCTAATQNNTDDLAWQGSNWGVATAPDGTADNFDAVEIVANVTEYFTIADDAAFEVGNFTVGCWSNPDANATPVISKGDVSNWEILHNAGQIRMEVRNNVERSPAGTVNLNVWHHLVLRHSTSTNTVEVFVDGVADCDGACQGSGGAPDQNAEALYVGGDSDGLDYDGTLMECFYFDAALTDTEIAEIFLCGLRGDADGEQRDTSYGGAECSAINTCC